MSGDRFSLTQSALVADFNDPRSEGWLSDNVLHPFLNGTGIVQIYNNFAEKKAAPAYVAPAKILSPDWAAQSLSSAAGAILTYTIVGKAAGSALSSVGNRFGLQGTAARIMASEATAQIAGSAVYDFARSPHEGETRLGNTAGSLVAFSLFSAGNNFLSRSKTIAQSSLNAGLGRLAVGAAGGLASLETANFVSNKLGVERNLSFDERLNALANGAFINAALPPIQKSLTTVIDHAVNKQSWGKGIPVERYLQYKQDSLKNQMSLQKESKTLASLQGELARFSDPALLALSKENPLARVKQAENGRASKADTQANLVWLNQSDGAPRLAHELKHLRIARVAESIYKEIGQLAKADPVQAESNFYFLRANMESTARQLETQVAKAQKGNSVPARNEGPEPVHLIATQKAGNGKTYFENWQAEWEQFKANPKFRPKFEYAADPATMQMGATVTDNGINFAVKSESASKIEVLIYNNAADKTPSRIVPLEKSGSTWHAFVDGLPEGTLYQYRAHGAHTPEKDGSRFNSGIGLVDPEARAVSKSEIPMDNRGGKAPENLGDMPKSIALKDAYDWQGDRPPNIPMTDTVIYELNVRGYTGADKSLGKMSGTYRGLIEKIPHLKELGVTAVELMPIMQGDRSPWPPKNPQTGEALYDSWNYNQVAYKAPDGSLAADGHLGKQVAEFKDLVKAMHANKMEVILDVVANHTREGDANGPTINLRGLDNKSYYLLKQGNPAEYVDKTGCGNTLNTNHPLTQELILNSLRYWVKEMHVDGFRFDLATIFKYDVDGQEKVKTPIMEKIENDPVLSKVKIIAEPWGPAQYQLGRFSDKLWSEWNGDYRDTVRKFVKSDTGQTATLAERIAGSPKWFDARTGRHSINAVTFHDGFSMQDLVSYNQKHNHANGENNRDGSNDNFSWNSGHEGQLDKANIPASQKAAIEALRIRQTKNMMSMLMLSRGTPLMVAGDEMRHSTFGNNNPWNQDKLNQIDWGLKDKNSDMFRFTSMMVELRKRHELGRLEPDSFIWHGTEPYKPDFAEHTRFIAWQTKAAKPDLKPIYSAFNAYWEPITVSLPPGNWYRLVDTNLPAGQDIVNPKDATFINKTYTIQPRSSIVLEGR